MTVEQSTKNEQSINRLIKAFVEIKTGERKFLSLGHIAVHNYLDSVTNIVHMIFNNDKKCVVFCRQQDENSASSETGNIIVYMCLETFSKDTFKERAFDIKMRYEWVSQSLGKVLQVNTM